MFRFEGTRGDKNQIFRTYDLAKNASDPYLSTLLEMVSSVFKLILIFCVSFFCYTRENEVDLGLNHGTG